MHSLIEVQQTGEYTFSLRTDRGSVMRIHDAIVIDADKGYSVISSDIYLEKGYHPIQLTYAHDDKRTSLLKCVAVRNLKAIHQSSDVLLGFTCYL